MSGDIPANLLALEGIEIVPGERRTPVAIARVMVGVVVVSYSVHGTRKGPFPIRPPVSAGGGPGAVAITAPLAAAIIALVQKGAEADPAVLAHLRGSK